MQLADLQPLLDLPGITWFSLQLGKGPSELAASRFAGRVHDLSSLLTDFSATAAVVSELDLLISVDTAEGQARRARRPLDAELRDLLIHGVLHLLGMDHETSRADARSMRALEEHLRWEIARFE